MFCVLLSKYNYQVVDIAPYHGHEKKLIDDINEVKIVKSFFNEIFSFKIFPQFNPAIIILAYCFSANSDVSMLLRRCGLFSIMVISHDLKMLTKNPKAELNEIQRDLLQQIGNNNDKLSQSFSINFYLFQPALILRSASSSGAGLGRARPLLLWRLSKLNSVTSKLKTNQSK